MSKEFISEHLWLLDDYETKSLARELFFKLFKHTTGLPCNDKDGVVYGIRTYRVDRNDVRCEYPFYINPERTVQENAQMAAECISEMGFDSVDHFKELYSIRYIMAKFYPQDTGKPEGFGLELRHGSFTGMKDLLTTLVAAVRMRMDASVTTYMNDRGGFNHEKESINVDGHVVNVRWYKNGKIVVTGLTPEMHQWWMHSNKLCQGMKQ